MRVNSLLKQASANASEHATEDQASDHSAQSKPNRAEFELEVTEEPPTQDQLKSILEYVGAQKASTIIKGARDEADAMRKLKENSESFQTPVVCFWRWLVVDVANKSSDSGLGQWTSCCGSQRVRDLEDD